jgi:hypothetical protein
MGKIVLLMTFSFDLFGASWAKSVVMTDRIIGCPHQAGVNYPKGQACLQCPFRAKWDRWTGEVLHEWQMSCKKGRGERGQEG